MLFASECVVLEVYHNYIKIISCIDFKFMLLQKTYKKCFKRLKHGKLQLFQMNEKVISYEHCFSAKKLSSSMQ